MWSYILDSWRCSTFQGASFFFSFKGRFQIKVNSYNQLMIFFCLNYYSLVFFHLNNFFLKNFTAPISRRLSPGLRWASSPARSNRNLNSTVPDSSPTGIWCLRQRVLPLTARKAQKVRRIKFSNVANVIELSRRFKNLSNTSNESTANPSRPNVPIKSLCKNNNSRYNNNNNRHNNSNSYHPKNSMIILRAWSSKRRVRKRIVTSRPAKSLRWSWLRWDVRTVIWFSAPKTKWWDTLRKSRTNCQKASRSIDVQVSTLSNNRISWNHKFCFI